MKTVHATTCLFEQFIEIRVKGDMEKGQEKKG